MNARPEKSGLDEYKILEGMKMRKVKVFNNTNEFLDWTEKFDDCYEYQFIPTIVVDQKKGYVCADLTTTCKSWKTALRRFRKAFETFDGIISWCDGLYETLEWEWNEGNFKTTHEFCEKERDGNSSFSYGIEEVSNGIWYIFLNLRGVYSGMKN